MRLWVRSGTLTVALILTLTVAACGADASTTGGKPSPPPSRATPMPTSSARTAVLATPSFHLKRIATGLIQPLYVTAPPGDTHRLFIVEKTGEIVILRDGVRLAAPFLNISNLVSQASEQGLLCLAFDPHFAANHRLYVSYTDLSNNVRVVRYTVSSGDPNRASPASAKLLLAVPHPFTNHNGGQLAFGPDGLLYIGLGDGGSEGDPRLYGQNLHVLLAKILRMDENAARPRPSIGSAPGRGRLRARERDVEVVVLLPLDLVPDPARGDAVVRDRGGEGARVAMEHESTRPGKQTRGHSPSRSARRAWGRRPAPVQRRKWSQPGVAS